MKNNLNVSSTIIIISLKKTLSHTEKNRKNFKNVLNGINLALVRRWDSHFFHFTTRQ